MDIPPAHTDLPHLSPWLEKYAKTHPYVSSNVPYEYSVQGIVANINQLVQPKLSSELRVYAILYQAPGFDNIEAAFYSRAIAQSEAKRRFKQLVLDNLNVVGPKYEYSIDTNNLDYFALTDHIDESYSYRVLEIDVYIKLE